jgi:trehalose-6-phosphate synthase
MLRRFHTYDYARHFVSACTRILGIEGTPEGVEDQGRLTRVAAVYLTCSLIFSNFIHLTMELEALKYFHQ